MGKSEMPVIISMASASSDGIDQAPTAASARRPVMRCLNALTVVSNMASMTETGATKSIESERTRMARRGTCLWSHARTADLSPGSVAVSAWTSSTVYQLE
eukprot:Amastigsp_a175663_24.p6 type:complete len:101 gc:universal Amastigsp_a175663_24:560-258(-)